ncbi:creatininase family protein [Paenibacillus flagellatus]|nr:creatininase family protein [Paenibacillus flagellatus]
MLTMFHTRNDFEAHSSVTAVLPIGAIEQHGSHLPVGTDTIIVGELAHRLAERLDAYLLPTLSITASIEHRKSKGTVYLKADTLALVIRDIADSLRVTGYRKLILVNGHGGNWILKPTIRQLNRDFEDAGHAMEVILITTGIVNKRTVGIVQHTEGDIHGGEKETSLMLHFCEEHVKKPVQQPPTAVPQDFLDYFDAVDLTGDGYWGFPEAASKEKGRLIADLFADCAVDYLDQIERVRKSLKTE